MPIFIGDVHAEWSEYNKIIQIIDKPTLQIGDFGIGFEHSTDERYNLDVMISGGHRFGRGNHDNPALCKTNPQYVPDGTMLDNGVYWIGGAYSIDRDKRIDGRDWWHDEELSMDELYKIMDDYEDKKPDILATHDCPAFLLEHIKMYDKFFCGQKAFKNRTQQALDAITHIHKPKIHVFGHYHREFDQVIDGTRYICVPILTVKEV